VTAPVRKIFWDDPYRDRWSTIVTATDGADITLAETIFYAASGGQESDHGTIAGRPVLAACKQGAQIIYRLASDHDLNPADPVDIAIEWPRRYRLMRLHFAAEITLELLTRQVALTEKIGAHIGAEKARIDLLWQGSIAPLLPSLTQAAQAIIDDNRPIHSDFSDPATERRFWEIPDFARVPCGGTHLKCTGEVGALRLKRNNIGKGKERIEIFVDDRPPPLPTG